jgi:hypothetical protein
MQIINLLPDHYLEHDYFNKMIQNINPKYMDGKKIYISHNYQTLPEYGRNIIAILTAGDESAKPPAYADNVGLVFKHHLDQDHIKNVYHIPLPYPNNFSGNNDIPIQNRKYDVFFAGCTRAGRNHFINESKLYQKHSKRNVHIKITRKFMTGYSMDEYSQYMSNSKITLSPRGWVRTECIRFTEAVKCGCGIITEKHADQSCFKSVPAFYINNWSSAMIDLAVESLLSEISIINKKTILSWNNFFSPEAVAHLINRTIGDVLCR